MRNRKHRSSEGMLLIMVTDMAVCEVSVYSAKNVARFLHFVGLS